MDYSNFKSTTNLVVLDNGIVKSYPLEAMNQWRIGRISSSSEVEIGLTSPIASRTHGVVALSGGKWTYSDKGSLNGTYYNGTKLEMTQRGESRPVELKNGDILRIDSKEFNSGENKSVWMMYISESVGKNWTIFPIKKKMTFVGRDKTKCDIVVPLSYVSGCHLIVTKEDDGYSIMDCDSKAGTYVNNVLINEKVKLKEKDLITICDCFLIYTEGKLIYNLPDRACDINRTSDNVIGVLSGTSPNRQKVVKPVQNAGAAASAKTPAATPKPSKKVVNTPVVLKANIVSKKVPSNTGHGEKELIKNVKVEVCEGTLVALLGGAGAGKSTVMNCMNGMETAGMTGSVVYKGVDLIRDFDRMKFLIGSVPQAEVFHESLTVEQELIHAAKHRLPADTTKAEINQKVDATLKQLGIEPIRKNKISKCSGGERRRVNIGIELVADRMLLCLDEPEAGLDPGNKKRLFETLNKLAHEGGKSVLTIIHDVSDIDLFDKIIIMNKVDGVGRLAFAGTPDEARKYFGCELKDVYEVMAKNPKKYIM